MDAAIAAAQHAFLSWSRASGVTDRAMLIGRVAKMHTERRIALATAMNEEMGKPIHEALAEVDFSASIYAYYAENAETFLADEPINLREGEGSALIRRQPVGVLLGIMPWNYPVYQVARFAGPNLALGNTVLLKHAPQCPQSAALLQEVFLEAGYPEGAYTNLYVSNGQVAQIIGDSRVQGISLTGSERAGSAVAQMAGRISRRSCWSSVARTRSSSSTSTTSMRPWKLHSPRGWRTWAKPATRQSASSCKRTAMTTSSPRSRAAPCHQPGPTLLARGGRAA